MELHPKKHNTGTSNSVKKTSHLLIISIMLLFAMSLILGWFMLKPDGKDVDVAEIIVSVDHDRNTNGKQQTYSSIGQHSETGIKENRETDNDNLSAVPEQALPLVAKKNLSTQQQCDQLVDSLSAFFNDLDDKPYIRAYELDQPCLQLFNELNEQLLANPPVVVRETDDLYTILTNMAHFFRIIGRKNVLLMKGILDRESDKIEDVAAELYIWTIVNQCKDNTLHMEVPLDKVYEYAGFFLNTMGGRSYLFRRDSRSRLLVNYYAILIIDRANMENMNRYGLDVNAVLPRLIQEIESTSQLIYKEDYLDTLYGLQEKYQPVHSE